MEVLFLDKGVVKMTEEGLMVPCFRELYDADKVKDKPRFKKKIEILWYLFSPDSSYNGMSYIEKCEVVEREHIDGKSISTYLEDMLFKNCIEPYKNLVLTREDRQYSKLMDELDFYIDKLQNIPLTKKAKSRMEVVLENGEKESQIVDVEVLNTEERSLARKEIKEMYALSDYITERMQKQGTIKKKKYLRIFDNNEG